MIYNYKDLTFITITYNNEEELLQTYESLSIFINNGARHLIINGGKHVDHSNLINSYIIEESDTGIYNALNKGLDKVTSKYLMFVHSGDLLTNHEEFNDIYVRHNELDMDLSFGATEVKDNNYYRLHSSYFWRPWMLKFYCQPPHLACIYKTKLFKEFRFNESLKITSDFYMFKDLFDKRLKWKSSKRIFIQQKPGGLSSNIFRVTNEFFNFERRLRVYLLFPMRIVLKLLLAVK